MERVTKVENKGIFGTMELFCILILVVLIKQILEKEGDSVRISALFSGHLHTCRTSTASAQSLLAAVTVTPGRPGQLSPTWNPGAKSQTSLERADLLTWCSRSR